MKEPRIHVIRDSYEARKLLVQGLWWQRVVQPHANNVRDVLVWAKELASGGQALPPIGFIGDLGHVALGEEWELRTGREPLQVPNLPMNTVRTYEDHVLGKIYSDWTFSRASDALRRYSKGREQARGLAYFFSQFRDRAKYDGIEISLGVINTLLDTPPDELLTEGWESLRQEGPHSLLPELYTSLIDASRRTPEVLGPDDIFDLERRYALEEFSQRLAHRQVLQVASRLEATLPKHKLKPKTGRMEVPTRILDEDAYPVGGFTSLSNRGSVESMLYSQLAYMEPDSNDRPDLFDTLFLLDELLYYSRDENQFLRRRRTFVLAMSPDLAKMRHQHEEWKYQHGVLVQGLVYVIVRKMAEWLSTDALDFQILTLTDSETDPLASEKAIYEKLFPDEIAQDIVHFGRMGLNKLSKACEEWSRRNMVHVLLIGQQPPMLEVKEVGVCRMAIKGPRPELSDGVGEFNPMDGEDAQDSWANAMQEVLQRWV